jgi:hypothetical protein
MERREHGDELDIHHFFVQVVFIIFGDKPRAFFPDAFDRASVRALHDLGVFGLDVSGKPHSVLVVTSSA